MNTKTGGNRAFQGMGWVGGSAVVLLLIGAGLAQFAHQAHGQEPSVATLLLALYLAAWLYVLGIVGLVLLPVWWLVGWLHVRATRAALRRYFPAPQFLQKGMAPVVPSRSSRESDDRNKATSPSRVA